MVNKVHFIDQFSCTSALVHFRNVLRVEFVAKVISANPSDNRGESLFVSKAVEYLEDDAIIYRNRQIFGKEFDACVLLPRKWILVIAVKGWREKSVLRVDSAILRFSSAKQFSPALSALDAALTEKEIWRKDEHPENAFDGEIRHFHDITAFSDFLSLSTPCQCCLLPARIDKVQKA